MARPNAQVFLSNGNLGGQAPSQYGVTGVAMATPAAPTAGYLTAFLVKTKKQAATAFADVNNAAVLTAVQAFFDEAPEGTSLWIICAAQTNSLTNLAGATMLQALLGAAAGIVRLAALIKFPAVSYVPTITQGFDVDVHNAVTAVQTVAATWLTARRPFRCLVQGYAFADASTAKDYSAAANRNVGIVVGSINGNTAHATMLALGRAAKVSPARNIGRVKSGSLVMPDGAAVLIGTAKPEAMTSVDLDLLHTSRYITFEANESASGYIFNDDNLLTSLADDYNNLRNGRVIDNAVRLAYSTYYLELKDDVDVEAGGRLPKAVERGLETKIEQAIAQQMGDQLSRDSGNKVAIKCYVNPDYATNTQLYESNGITSAPNFNLLQAGQVYIFVLLRPKGCIKYIGVYLGFTTN